MADAKQAWHDRSHLEMRRARQRDEMGVAVWKRGQPDNQDDQAHPENFILHMHIERYCVCNIYIYILPLFVYSTPPADRECACVDEIAI